MKSRYDTDSLGNYVKIRTGNLDANANDPKGIYPFFSCAVAPLRINSYSFDCECVLVAGNGDLNVKYYDGKFDAYQRTYVIESLDKARLSPRYLFHFLSIYVQKLREMSIGGVIKYIKLNYLTDAEIPLPPLDEQQRIAAILDKADSIRQRRQESICLTDEFLRSVFLDMFGDPITNPKRWPEVRLGDVIEGNPNNGIFRKNEEYGGDVPVVWVKELFAGYVIDTSSSVGLSPTAKEVEKYSLRRGDILFCRSSLKLGGIGYTNVYWGDNGKALFECHLIRVRPKPNIMNGVFYNFLLRQPGMRERIIKQSNTVTMSTIGQDQVRDIKHYLPPIALQEKFAACVLKLTEKQNRKDAFGKLTDQLFNSLSTRAFRGEL
ncbi:MAG: restriction endonuclease subunit S [Thermodesulfobacteriota bacterium]